MTQSGALSLARYVPRIALDWVVDRPDELWRSVDGTMVFADISGFTALSERLATRGRIGAEELVETLSRVFGAMLDTASERGGQLLKFGGDALLFLFDGDDHARQAASTAVEMRAELRRASDIVTSVGRLSLSVSIGVHTGVFDLFLVGEPHRELVVLGPGTSAVVAAENAANAGEIVLSPGAVAALGPHDVRLRDDGTPMLRWRKAPVEPSGPPLLRPTDDEAARRLLPAIVADPFEHSIADPAHRVATISFMKFSGTDALLEQEGPAVLAERLHETLSIAQAAFIEEDVALLCVDCDSDGGKIFCSTGVPLTSEDDEGRMLRAARAIIAARPPLPLQIGINRGHVFAAEVGTPRRASYSAMGDTTNTAARICGKSEKEHVFVHPAVLEHARTLYESEPVGPFTFKGKALPQMLYALGDEIGQRAEDGNDGTPFIGREDDLERLSSLVTGLADGTGGDAVVVGPVGIGKSRLVREALSSAASPVVMLHAEPYGAANAFRIFRDPLRSALGIERGLQREMAGTLRKAVRRLVPHHEPMLALIADVLQIEVDPSDDVLSLLPEYRPDRTADVVIDLLSGCFPGGFVMVVEDAHWADDPSTHLIGRLARETAMRPWAVIVVRRDEAGGVELEQPAMHLEVDLLAPEAIRAITIATTEAAPLRPHELDQIVERAGGNPLFAEELVRAIQDLGSLEAVPTSLQGAMAASVDALDPFSKRVLSYASVLGRSFRRTVLAEVLRAEDMIVDEATVERLTRFLERDGRTRFRFRNGLLRDVVYDGLGFKLRSRLHLQAGEAVERLSSDISGDADTLALHFSAAGDHARAYRYGRLAAERSERSYANATAAAQLELALDAGRRLRAIDDDELRDLWLRLGQVREDAGLLHEAIDAYRQALRLIGDPFARCDVRLRVAWVRVTLGAYPVALGELTRLLRDLAALDNESVARLRSRAVTFAAYVRRRQERLELALPLAEAAVQDAERSGDIASLARAYSILAWAGFRLERENFVEYTERALELFERAGDLAGAARMAGNLGGYEYYAGDWVATLEWYWRSEQACDRIGNVTESALTKANIGEVLVSQGKLDEAKPVLEDAARALRVSGHITGAVFADMQLGRLALARRDVDEAELLLRRAMSDNETIGNNAGSYEAAIHLARTLTARGEPEAAVELLERMALKSTEELSILDAALANAQAEALVALGRPGDAAAWIRSGIESARRRTLEFDLATLLVLADQLGVVTEGELPPSDEARAIFDRLGVVDTSLTGIAG